MLTTPLLRSQSDCLALLPRGSRSGNVHTEQRGFAFAILAALFPSQSSDGLADRLAQLPRCRRDGGVHSAVRNRVRLLLGRWGRRFDGLAARPRPLLLAQQTLRSG